MTSKQRSRCVQPRQTSSGATPEDRRACRLEDHPKCPRAGRGCCLRPCPEWVWNQGSRGIRAERWGWGHEWRCSMSKVRLEALLETLETREGRQWVVGAFHLLGRCQLERGGRQWGLKK